MSLEVDGIKLPEGFLQDAQGKIWVTPDRCFKDMWGTAEWLATQMELFTSGYCLGHGGYGIGAVVGNRIKGLRVQALDVHSYDGEKRGEMIGHLPPALVETKGSGVLVVDDLVDDGATARFVKEQLPEAYFVTVYSKHRNPSRAGVNYYHQELPRRWLVLPWEQPMTAFRT